MKQEYLFTSDDFKEELEAYKPENVEKRIVDIENSSCWLLTFVAAGDSEKCAVTLSKINDELMEQYKPIVLSNESSAYFNKVLFPLINEFERKLRKFLYLKSALSEKAEEFKIIENLEKKDFGELFSILFTDQGFINNTKQAVNSRTWKYTKEEILETIRRIEEDTFWDSQIGKEIVGDLREQHIEVKDYRNDVMHAHNMDLKEFRESKKLFQKINEQLDIEISKIIIDTEDGNKDEKTETYNENLEAVMQTMDSLTAKPYVIYPRTTEFGVNPKYITSIYGLQDDPISINTVLGYSYDDLEKESLLKGYISDSLIHRDSLASRITIQPTADLMKGINYSDDYLKAGLRIESDPASAIGDYLNNGVSAYTINKDSLISNAVKASQADISALKQINVGNIDTKLKYTKAESTTGIQGKLGTKKEK